MENWEMIKKTVGNAEFTFWLRARDTRHGFAHDAELYLDGKLIGSDTAFYLNRTWEAYRYQSVMLGAVNSAINYARAKETAEIKERLGWKRLTAERRARVNRILDTRDGIRVLNALKEDVLNSKYGTERERDELKALDALLAVVEVLFGRDEENATEAA